MGVHRTNPKIWPADIDPFGGLMPDEPGIRDIRAALAAPGHWLRVRIAAAAIIIGIGRDGTESRFKGMDIQPHWTATILRIRLNLNDPDQVRDLEQLIARTSTDRGAA